MGLDDASWKRGFDSGVESTNEKLLPEVERLKAVNKQAEAEFLKEMEARKAAEKDAEIFRLKNEILSRQLIAITTALNDVTWDRDGYCVSCVRPMAHGHSDACAIHLAHKVR